MKLPSKLNNISKPLTIKLGFGKLIDQLDEYSKDTTKPEAKLYKQILDNLEHRESLVEGIEEDADLKIYEKDFSKLLSILFPSPLLTNEIKAVFSSDATNILHSSTRFNSVFGDINKLEPKEFGSKSEDEVYISMCTFILGGYYQKSIISNVPPVYSIMDQRGVKKYYKSTMNADFFSIKPLYNPPIITESIINELKENFEDIALWKELFPPNSWELKGFSIKNFTDISYDEAISLIKDNLIGNAVKTNHNEFKDKMNSNISTLLDVPNVEVQFIMYDNDKSQFLKSLHGDEPFAMLCNQNYIKKEFLCDCGISNIFKTKDDFVIYDLDELPESVFDINIYKALRQKNIKSYIMTPLYFEDQLLGVLEFASKDNKALYRTHQYKIEKMKGLCINAIKQFTDEKEDQISSIIQNEFTSIHPSVEWKFREEAEKALIARQSDNQYSFGNITFGNLTALYGQMDIAGSSVARNNAIAEDLRTQLVMARSILDQMSTLVDMPLLESIQFQTAILFEKLNTDLAAGMEQEVTDYITSSINPLFDQMRLRDDLLNTLITEYFDSLDEKLNIIYNKRKDYDKTVQIINMHLSGRLDEEQKKAQIIYPHFFERYKTDGVEHNMYIGTEISPTLPYNKLYLENLRLWQLKTICQLEREHNNILPELSVPLKIASLIMVYSSTLAIKYRLDEKQFDIDGAYNARYEIIKKRIDKAHIKGTNERITQPGKIVIIYTQTHDLDEYLSYISFLTQQGYLQDEPELFDIEDLQGIVGLKGLRVNVLFEDKSSTKSKNKIKLDTNTKINLSYN